MLCDRIVRDAEDRRCLFGGEVFRYLHVLPIGSEHHGLLPLRTAQPATVGRCFERIPSRSPPVGEGVRVPHPDGCLCEL
jgi:hypothetical protein